MQKSWTWSTTGFGFASKSPDDIITICHTTGLDGIEAVPPFLDGLRDAEVEALGEKYRNAAVTL